MTEGIKNDKGKRQWWYLDHFWEDIGQVVDVLEFGDRKYPANDGANWKRLENPQRRFKDALFRHMVAYRQGEKNDPETSKSHLAHLITNALILMYFDRKHEIDVQEEISKLMELADGISELQQMLDPKETDNEN